MRNRLTTEGNQQEVDKELLLQMLTMRVGVRELTEAGKSAICHPKSSKSTLVQMLTPDHNFLQRSEWS